MLSDVRFLTADASSFFFRDPATTEIYTLSLHDALPIWSSTEASSAASGDQARLFISLGKKHGVSADDQDRKSTRLNSSHVENSYAVFRSKKKNENAHSSQSVSRTNHRLCRDATAVVRRL